MSLSPPRTALLVLLLLVFVVVVVCKKTTHASVLDAATTMGVSPQKMERIQRFLEKINKSAIKSIKSPDGDIIDCVLMNKQLAFDHPLLKNHKIQRVAPEWAASRSDAGNEQPRKGTTRRALQAWNIVDNCPDGTVSVRRTTVEDVLRAGSLSRFGKKYVHEQLAAAKHEYAIAAANQQAYGTKTTINVWNPSVRAHSGEFSLSQIWLAAGSYASKDINTIEVGWQVYPGKYGDNKTRLFIYWTRDAYNKTGCYNLDCPGFVQMSGHVTPGGTIDPVSTYNGSQIEKTLHVRKDPITGDWWLMYDYMSVGYWPAAIFTHLKSYATSVQWGGEIVNTVGTGRRTTTPMGSGHFAKEGYRKASYFRNVEVVNATSHLIPPQSVYTFATHPNCYDIRNSSNASWGFHFFYGGPGRNPKCP